MGDSYPKRPKFFAFKFCRLMARVCLANEVGPETCWLLAVIAHTEDAKQYRDAVTYFNEHLGPLVGAGCVGSLARMRTKAINAGWLHYEPGTKRKAGKYWVTIPPKFEGVGDKALDEDPTEYLSENEQETEEIPIRKCTSKLKESVEESCRKAEGKLKESAQHSTLYLTLTPDPSPVRAFGSTEAEPPVCDSPGDPLSSENKNNGKSLVALRVDQVIEHYKVHHPHSRPGEKERARIRKRLHEGYTVEQLLEAIDGCHKSPWHSGDNPDGTRYQSLELIMRDSSHVARFIELNKHAGTRTAANRGTMERMLERYADDAE